MFKLPHIVLISHVSKVMFKILQARLQQYLNQEIPEFNLDLEKTEEQESKLPASAESPKSKRVPEKHLLLLCLDCTKAFDCVDHNKLKNSSRDGNTRPLYLPPEKSVCRSRSNVRTSHGTTDWFQIGKGGCQGCILSQWLFNLYAEYIMWNAWLDEPQAGIKTAGRNIDSLRYADDTTLMAESEEELNSLLMKVKEDSEKSWLQIQHSED